MFWASGGVLCGFLLRLVVPRNSNRWLRTNGSTPRVYTVAAWDSCIEVFG